MPRGTKIVALSQAARPASHYDQQPKSSRSPQPEEPVEEIYASFVLIGERNLLVPISTLAKKHEPSPPLRDQAKRLVSRTVEAVIGGVDLSKPDDLCGFRDIHGAINFKKPPSMRSDRQGRPRPERRSD